jgi:RNA polymerase sigma factor (sigma-70 family)
MKATAIDPRATSRGRLAGNDVARLVTRAASGDRSAWDRLVDEVGGLVWAAARAQLSEADAADVVQTTWLRLVEHLDRIGDPSRLGSWLATTARRECLGVNRRAARCIPRGEELPDLPVDAPRPSERLISEHNAVAVRAALERLGPRDRALLRMLTVEPTPSHEEISVALDLAVGSIGPKRARALTRLSEAMGTGSASMASSCA